MLASTNLLGAAWARPSISEPRLDARDDHAWLAASSGELRISGDLNPAARGLSVAQHSALVLAALCGDGEAQAR